MMNSERSNLMSEQAYQQIKRMIITLELPPGAFINERELREQIDFGRTPIREALLRLSLEQLVSIIPRRGIAVSEIALNDLQHLYEVRLSLESLAIRLAARRGSVQQWEQMERALKRVLDDELPVDNEVMITVDEQCHQIIYQATGNRFLENNAATLYDASLRLWYYFIAEIGPMRHAVLEHQLMLEALRARDEDEAARLIEKHIRTFHQEIQEAMIASDISPETVKE
jgi:DNA-binding GntR family transcriptional regulator